ncbi:hypothetical protein CXJ72_004525, partial [Escherichia coli]|nr:hypothetical protein [Escherichia coli]
MNKKNEITLWGYYGFNNLGDDVMLDVCLKEIKSTKKYETINVYGNYQEIDKIDGVVFHPLAGIKNKVEFLKSILKSDKLIWGGGTCFYKDNNTGYSGLFLLFVISLFCVLFRKKNFFLGIGLGKLNSSL